MRNFRSLTKRYSILEVFLNMVISLIPSSHALVEYRDNLLIKIAPETVLPITSNPVRLEMLLSFHRRDRMFVPKMLAEKVHVYGKV